MMDISILVMLRTLLRKESFSFNLGEKVDASTGFIWLLLVTAFRKLF